MPRQKAKIEREIAGLSELIIDNGVQKYMVHWVGSRKCNLVLAKNITAVCIHYFLMRCKAHVDKNEDLLKCFKKKSFETAEKLESSYNIVKEMVEQNKEFEYGYDKEKMPTVIQTYRQRIKKGKPFPFKMQITDSDADSDVDSSDADSDTDETTEREERVTLYGYAMPYNQIPKKTTPAKLAKNSKAFEMFFSETLPELSQRQRVRRVNKIEKGPVCASWNLRDRKDEGPNYEVSLEVQQPPNYYFDTENKKVLYIYPELQIIKVETKSGNIEFINFSSRRPEDRLACFSTVPDEKMEKRSRRSKSLS